MANDKQEKMIIVNTEHSRQDINQIREYDPSRLRYSFASALLPHLNESNKGQIFIDIGGGAGEFTGIARSKGYKTILIDGNINNVNREITMGYEATQLDLNQGLTEISDNKCDVAVCLDVIEHIVPAENLLREIHRVLKPDGILIISTPNFSYILDRLSYLFGEDVREEGYHYRFFTRKKFLKLLEDAGFILESSNSMGSAIGINRLLKALTWGKARIPKFRVAPIFESWLCSTFVYKMRNKK
ncbi:class I SAM-dependent methyltransferase [Cyanobacterium sp. Dongsha4]|uniref:class I SAM-dependent methyltransferase n=1 Tax=Cyanobacterium sp. DS4 TaxID=2878255 RepID=UPI002E807C5B|nr:class I SAM-dependent methyltransferase [Cyanobacterium sp. Dongsha4]WVK99940.1 class I SAM-dependent methyltransferase [Cyanobacterium sp. Dongsha4]